MLTHRAPACSTQATTPTLAFEGCEKGALDDFRALVGEVTADLTDLTNPNPGPSPSPSSAPSPTPSPNPNQVTAEFASALSTLVGSDGPPLLLAAQQPLRTVEEVATSGETLTLTLTLTLTPTPTPTLTLTLTLTRW